MRIVLDSNVIVSAFAAPGLCQEVLDYSRKQGTLIVSVFILREVQRVLSNKIKLASGDVREILKLLRLVGEVVATRPLVVENLRDSNDAAVIATALAGTADVIVTGDRDLLVLRHYKGVKILSPRDFLQQFCK